MDRKHKRRAVVWVVAVLTCILCYPRVAALLQVDRVIRPDGKVAANRANDLNVLLLGVDEREGDRGRSDTMMLLHYDAKRNKAQLMSIPRDTRVKLPKYGYQKINAAYTLGGPALAKQALEDLTGLHVDYYLKVTLDGFPEVVDALGGVFVDVKTRMSYDDPYQDLHIHFEPGRQKLDGERALEYVRWRGDARSDLGRADRQKEFLVAAFRRALSPAGLWRAPLVLYAAGRCLETDIPLLAQPGIVGALAVAYLKGIETSTVPGTTANIGDGSYFIADLEALKAKIASWAK